MIIQLDTENADRDLTSQITVLTHTPNASNPMACQVFIKFGDGAKDLDGSGGNFELTITIGGQTIEPDPQTILFSTATRTSVWTTPFPVPAGDEVVIKVKSPNAADSDVDVTAYLYADYANQEVIDIDCPPFALIGDSRTLLITANTRNPITGAAQDADAVPTYRVYEQETTTPILTGSMAKLDDDNTTGFYSERITVSSGNGFENVKDYTIRVSATVDGLTAARSSNFTAMDTLFDMLGGAYQCTLTLKDTGGSTAIEGAKLWLSKNATGTPTYGSAQYTDGSGQVVYWLDDDKYYVFASGAGYSYDNDESITVNGSAVTQSFNYGTQVTAGDDISGGITGGMDAFLVRCVDDVRMLVDESETNDKYSDTKLISMIESAYAEILQDAQRSSTSWIRAKYEFDYDDDVSVYDLPATCGVVICVCLEDDNGLKIFFDRGSDLSHYGTGVTIEGSTLVFQPNIVANGETITVYYLPDGCAKLFTATTSTYDNNASPNTITASTVDNGYRDRRANAYLGYRLRVLTDGYVQEKIISAQDGSKFSVSTEFNPELSGEVVFEAVPDLPVNLDMVVASKVALIIAGIEGLSKERSLEKIYTNRMRTIHLGAANKDFDHGSPLDRTGRHYSIGRRVRRRRW